MNIEKNRISNIMLIAIFVFFIATLSLGSILLKDKDFSEVENRVLSKAPKFSVDSLVKGEYTDSLETYASDQVIFKDTFVTLKNQIVKILGRNRVNNTYYADGMYIQEYIEDEKQLLDNANSIKRWCEQNGYKKNKIFMLLAPNSSEVYKSKLPCGNINESEVGSIKKVEAVLDDSLTFVAPFDTLKKHSDEYIYYNTDHHWTMLGAYYAYEELADKMKIKPVKLEQMNRFKVRKPFYGSLYSQAPLLFTEKDNMTVYDYPKLKYTVSQINYRAGKVIEQKDSYMVKEKFGEKDKYAALFGGNFAYVKIKNDTPSKMAKGKKLLVFKDSYANSIMPFLIDAYEEIDMIDLRYFDYMSNRIDTLGKDNGYDNVLFLYNVSFLNSDKNFIGLSY